MSIESRSSQYGVVFEHWQIREMLGHGSGGKTAVFRLIRNDSFEESCALKVINLIEESGRLDDFPDYRKQEYLDALEESKHRATPEVQMMLSLRGNTNVVDYLDHKFVNWSDASGFGCDLLIRMELLSDLRSIIKTGRVFDDGEVLHLGQDICTALVLCHENGILHRDIKPENIMINRQGNYKLGDFGVSRLLGNSASSMATTGIGTPEYAAPEQFSGKHDKRVDIYSLGLVLYELCNYNKLPFASSSYVRQEDIQKRQSGVPLPKPDGISSGLWSVIQKACAFKPSDRYATAQQFLDALCALERPASTAPQAAAAEADVNQTVKASPSQEYKTQYAFPNAAPDVNPQTADAEPSVPARSKKLPIAPIIAGLLITTTVLVGIVVISRPPKDAAKDAEMEETVEATDDNGEDSITSNNNSHDASASEPAEDTAEDIFISASESSPTESSTEPSTAPAQVEPVWLTDLAYYSNDGVIIAPDANGVANNGQTYSHILWSWDSGSEITYYLNGQYSTISGLWAINYAGLSTTFKNAFEILADGVSVYVSPYLSGMDEPVSFTVDIGNCDMLVIRFLSTDGEGEIGDIILR